MGEKWEIKGEFYKPIMINLITMIRLDFTPCVYVCQGYHALASRERERERERQKEREREGEICILILLKYK